jgi:hypothetical protein
VHTAAQTLASLESATLHVTALFNINILHHHQDLGANWEAQVLERMPKSAEHAVRTS